MASPDDIKIALERNVKAVSLRPSVGQGTAVTRVRLGADLRCDIEEGSWKLKAGMTEKYGGDGSAPNPGVLGRAAIGSCLAIGYAMWASRLQVPITSLEVEIQADYDVRGELGASDDVRPGYGEIRYIVKVESDAPAEDVEKMLEIAERRSSWLDVVGNATPMRREVHITSPARS
ncbi:MAG: OsmC family protein [Acidobacteria bacterium]|nr:OsmC family protein [Acidobacteriota bacterium]